MRNLTNIVMKTIAAAYTVVNRFAINVMTNNIGRSKSLCFTLFMLVISRLTTKLQKRKKCIKKSFYFAFTEDGTVYYSIQNEFVSTFTDKSCGLKPVTF